LGAPDWRKWFTWRVSSAMLPLNGETWVFAIFVASLVVSFVDPASDKARDKARDKEDWNKDKRIEVTG
jgi:hypothetical protein